MTDFEIFGFFSAKHLQGRKVLSHEKNILHMVENKSKNKSPETNTLHLLPFFRFIKNFEKASKKRLEWKQSSMVLNTW